MFFEVGMRKYGENTELLLKYCAHIGANVTMAADENGRICLCSHLCHGQKCEERNFNAAASHFGTRGIDINEKQE